MQAAKSTINIVKTTLRADPNLSDVQRRAALDALSGKSKVKVPEKVESPLLSQAEAARYLNCSRFTIRRMRIDGDLNPVKIRGLVRYLRAELDVIINSK